MLSSISINYLLAAFIWLIFFAIVYVKRNPLLQRLPYLKQCYNLSLNLAHYLLFVVFVIFLILNLFKSANPIPLIDYLILLLSTAIIAPLAEEIVFRGFFIGFFEKFLNKYKTIILVIGINIFFALIHNFYSPITKPLQELFFTFLLGISVSIIYLKSNKNILYPILIHASYNMIRIYFAI